MKIKKLLGLFSVAVLSTSLVACGVNSSETEKTSSENAEKVAAQKQSVRYVNANYVDYVQPSDIVKDTKNIGSKYKKYYVKYLDYMAPNGKPIRIVAANKVSDEQMLKAYNVLSFYLTDYGKYKKQNIANSMANKGAVLVMPNGADGDGKTPDDALAGQPLYQMEVPTAGSKWYQENDYKHRDAAYEEIFHMVHDYGIGTTSNPAAEPKLAKQIKTGLDSVLPKAKKDWGNKGIWGLGSREWILSLAKEKSLEQEYVVSGIDSYYGLWEAYTESDKGMWGMYVPKNRAAVKAKDPHVYQIITSFMPENFTYMERIDSNFAGVFQMSLDPKKPYTYKSQYLQNARLTGKNNSALVGNDLDNILLGNAGSNQLDGGKGNDVVQFSGAFDEYKISKSGNKLVVTDTKNRDGKDTLTKVEILRFTDMDVLVSSIK